MSEEATEEAASEQIADENVAATARIIWMKDGRIIIQSQAPPTVILGMLAQVDTMLRAVTHAETVEVVRRQMERSRPRLVIPQGGMN